MQGQDVWTSNGSLKLKKLLEGETEIQMNKEALRDLNKAFFPQKRLQDSHSAILFIEDLQLPQPTFFAKKYSISTFKVNELIIWQDPLSMQIPLFISGYL
ncbi:DUF4858 domain-containing protein [Bacteroides sp. AN502(2024)]|uniref:DUF4858 domain-containing protein n=1 Tax=Bacteroides sp. AN502(2024) TaxID=3160599 RepID=UPI0035152870